MSSERWIAGIGTPSYAWANAFNAADINSLAANSSVLSSVADIPNDTNADIYCDLSIALGSITPVAPNSLAFFIYPLNQDGTTYGDSALTPGTKTATTPASQNWVGTIQVPAAVGAWTGYYPRIILPPGKFRFAVQNLLGVTMSGGSNVIKYITYNRQLV